MGRQIEGLARFVAETQWEDIPNRCNGTRSSSFSTLGVRLAG
jgi:hypothetical protein